jgi:hypothetical protein
VGYLLPQLIGSFIGVALFSRAFGWLYAKRFHGPPSAVGLHLFTLAFATVIGGLGLADGGPPQFAAAFEMYLIPSVCFMLWDRRTEQAAASVAPSPPPA